MKSNPISVSVRILQKNRAQLTKLSTQEIQLRKSVFLYFLPQLSSASYSMTLFPYKNNIVPVLSRLFSCSPRTPFHNKESGDFKRLQTACPDIFPAKGIEQSL